jgi:fatty acid desaturase
VSQAPIPPLPMAEAKRIVQGFFTPNPLLYWADFLFFDLLGWTSFVLAVRIPFHSVLEPVALAACAFSLYRAVLFVHELAHFKKGTFRFFHLVWNLVCGIPLTLPSFLYLKVHLDHHKRKVYGTRYDPEYFPFTLAKPYRIPLFPLTMLVAPVFFLLRFLVVAPLSYLLPALREPLWIYGSSLAVGGDYRRPLPDRAEKRMGFLQELATFLCLALFFFLMARGILPWKALAVWYGMAVFILVTNALRSLVAHCDRNPPDHIMTFEEQFLDSTDIPGNPLLTPLWAPVGLRYHATHHLFPAIPYHFLGKAHRKLMRELPPGNPYPQALRKSLWSALAQLWRETCGNNRKG